MLYLHIGTGKAGSTSIQKFLELQKYALPYKQIEAFGSGYRAKIANAWKIAAAANTERSRRYWVQHRKLITESDHQELVDNFWDEVKKEVGGSGAQTFIASSEYIYGQYGNEKDRIEELRVKLLSIFSDVKIIVYFRDQVSFVKSAYAQRVKGPTRSADSYASFIKNITSLNVPIDYAEKVKLWGSIFGYNRIQPVVFDRKNFLGGSLIADFLNRIDLDDFKVEIGQSKVTENRSPTFFQLNLLRLGNLLNIQNRQTRDFMVSRITGQFPPKTFPSKYDNRILQMVSDGNKWLNERFFFDQNAKLPYLEFKHSTDSIGTSCF